MCASHQHRCGQTLEKDGCGCLIADPGGDLHGGLSRQKTSCCVAAVPSGDVADPVANAKVRNIRPHSFDDAHTFDAGYARESKCPIET